MIDPDEKAREMAELAGRAKPRGLPQDVADFVYDSLTGCPTTSMGRGSETERRNVSAWLRTMQERYDLASHDACRFSPEAQRVLNVIAADLGLRVNGRVARIESIGRGFAVTA